jgi:hypothetical protein
LLDRASGGLDGVGDHFYDSSRVASPLIPIAIACSLFAHTGKEQVTTVSFVDIRDSSLRAQSGREGCTQLGQDVHAWVGYYWFPRMASSAWTSESVTCTALWPAHSGVDSTLILIRSNRPGKDAVADRLCAKLSQP